MAIRGLPFIYTKLYSARPLCTVWLAVAPLGKTKDVFWQHGFYTFFRVKIKIMDHLVARMDFLQIFSECCDFFSGR